MAGNPAFLCQTQLPDTIEIHTKKTICSQRRKNRSTTQVQSLCYLPTFWIAYKDS